MAVLPLLAFNTLWPPLAANDVAGSLVSALAMAGAVYQLWALVREWGISLLPRLVLVAVFALNPMIVYYAANGMSEGLYLFTMVATVRYLSGTSATTTSARWSTPHRSSVWAISTGPSPSPPPCWPRRSSSGWPTGRATVSATPGPWPD